MTSNEKQSGAQQSLSKYSEMHMPIILRLECCSLFENWTGKISNLPRNVNKRWRLNHELLNRKSSNASITILREDTQRVSASKAKAADAFARKFPPRSAAHWDDRLLFLICQMMNLMDSPLSVPGSPSVCWKSWTSGKRQDMIWSQLEFWKS